MGGELKSEQAIISAFQALRRELSALADKLGEMAAETQEHDLTLKQLEPLEQGRRCYRQIGDVLVEQTVAQVVPALSGHRDQLLKLVGVLRSQRDAKEKELLDFQQKYKIRVKGEPEAQPASKPQSQGVLV